MNPSYYIVENQMTEPSSWTAIPAAIASLDKEALISEIINRGSTLTRTDILAVLNATEEVVVKASLNGMTVNLPLFNTMFSISGIFDGTGDFFDENRHKFNINLVKGVLLRDAEKKSKLNKIQPPAEPTRIRELKDSVSQKVNECLTARGIVEIRGYNIKIEGDDPDCGLWFVPENGTQTKAKVIVENKPSKVYAMIPDIDPANGAYQVKIVTQYTCGGIWLKTPRIFVYPKKLTVVHDG